MRHILLLGLLNHQVFFSTGRQQILCRFEDSDSLGHLPWSVIQTNFILRILIRSNYTTMSSLKGRFNLAFFTFLYGWKLEVSLHNISELLRSCVFRILSMHDFTLMML